MRTRGWLEFVHTTAALTITEKTGGGVVHIGIGSNESASEDEREAHRTRPNGTMHFIKYIIVRHFT